MTTELDLDNLYKVLLGRGPDAYQGGTIQDSAKQYWTNQYNQMGGGQAGLDSVISGIKGSDEYKGLGFDAGFDHFADPLAAQHIVQAQKSIAKGDGVRAGTVASYSDMYNADGTPNPDWVDEKTWLQNKVNELAGGGGMSTAQYNALMGGYNSLAGDFASLKEAMAQNQADMMNMWNNANWGQGGYGQQGQTVSGVKTQNELPGWKPKTGGSSGFFGRGGSRFGLSTSSLNTA